MVRHKETFQRACNPNGVGMCVVPYMPNKPRQLAHTNQVAPTRILFIYGAPRRHSVGQIIPPVTSVRLREAVHVPTAASVPLKAPKVMRTLHEKAA